MLVHSRPTSIMVLPLTIKFKSVFFLQDIFRFFERKKLRFFFVFPKNFHIKELKENHMVPGSLESPNKSRDSRDYEKPNKLAKQIRANKLQFSETLNPKQEINSQQIQEGSKVQKLCEWKKVYTSLFWVLRIL